MRGGRGLNGLAIIMQVPYAVEKRQSNRVFDGDHGRNTKMQIAAETTCRINSISRTRRNKKHGQIDVIQCTELATGESLCTVVDIN